MAPTNKTAQCTIWDELEDDDDIALVETNYKVHTFVHERREMEEVHPGRKLNEQVPPGISMVEANQLPPLNLPNGVDPIKICVVDTGYGIEHPDLPDQSNNVEGFKPNGIGGSWNVDGDSHGTHCAGTIGAIGGNGVGVVGVLDDPDDFQFFIGKGLSDSGSGTTATVMDSVEACVLAGAKVISMSLGGGGYSQINNDLYQSYYNSGVLIIYGYMG